MSVAVSERAEISVPWRWRVVAFVSLAAGVVTLGFVLAHWGWRWFGPADSPPTPAATGERAAAAIIATPFFGSPAASVASGASAPTPAQGDARLLGVFAEPGGTGYALFRLADRGSILVAAGGKIADDVTLAEVRPGGVRIRDHGEVRDIELRAAPAPGTAASTAAAKAGPAARGAPRAACAAPPGYRGPIYRLNAELLTGVASQPESWKTFLVPVPGGLAVRDDSGFAAMLGMKTGDRMLQANGIALSGVADVIVAFVNPLVASQSVRVTGVRGGKPADWLFLNAGACPS